MPLSMRAIGLVAFCALAVLAPKTTAQVVPPGTCTSNFYAAAPGVKAAAYNPTVAQFDKFMDAIDCLGLREHRACNQMIRMFFHDGGAVDTSKVPANAADGSTIINDSEGLLSFSFEHGEAPMTRYVLSKLATKFGLSYADALGLAAAQCTQTFGSQVNIIGYSNSKGFDIRVGKLDNANVDINSVKTQLPTFDERADGWLKYWRADLNSKIPVAKWKFTVREAAALMGSHILVDPHACSRGASGAIRNRRWDNGYFLDVMSGRVELRAPPADAGPEVDVIGACDFTNDGYKRKTVNSIHEAFARQIAANTFVPPADAPGALAVFWAADPSRATCTGDDSVCKPCSSGDSRAPCAGAFPGESPWPYTVNDGFLALAARFPLQYCSSAPGGCAEFYPARDTDFPAIQRAYQVFRNNMLTWMQTYAIAHSKLSNIGAKYAANSFTMFSKYGAYNGQCSKAGPDVVAIINDIVGPPPCDVPDPTAPANDPEEGGCFPADALVMTPSGGAKRMDDVIVGDHVAVAKADGSVAFEMVYAQGHADPAAVASFVRLSLAAATGAEGRKTLELTAKHFMPVKAAAGRKLTRAEDVKVGDIVWALTGAARTSEYVVTSVEAVMKQGLYNPYTLGGSIVVNSVEASCHSEWVLDGVFDVVGASHHLPAVYQALLAPVRWFLYIVGPSAYVQLAWHKVVMAALTAAPAQKAVAVAAAIAAPFLFAVVKK